MNALIKSIRLWGDHGQNLLENSKVCLVNANALGCEVLKGLVLPGIGGFTIADGSVVTEDDLGVKYDRLYYKIINDYCFSVSFWIHPV